MEPVQFSLRDLFGSILLAATFAGIYRQLNSIDQLNGIGVALVLCVSAMAGLCMPTRWWVGAIIGVLVGGLIFAGLPTVH